MLETPQIIQTTAQATAVIPFQVSTEEMRQVMGPALEELSAALAAQGILPTGSWFTHHLTTESELWDFELGFPVSAPVKAIGRVQPRERPAQRAARTVYRGPYEGLGDAWGQFIDWVVKQGHTPAIDLYECYLAGPEASDDPADWRTELTRPLTS